MARSVSTVAALVVASLVVACWHVQASDPEITTDFTVPPGCNATDLYGNYFTSTALRSVPAKAGDFATVTPVNVGNFAALEGLGVSSALLQFPAGAVNVPHTHPRGTEILFILEGVVNVGLIDTTNKLFTQTLQAGDLFVFPKGLVHFQVNYQNYNAKALAAFSSSNPGVVRLPNTLFKSTIFMNVLAKSFGVSSDVIAQLMAATVS